MKSKVKLISITKPVLEGLKDFSYEEVLVYIARVSNPLNQLNTETSERLLKYCLKNGHWSVFEHCYLTYEINTSTAIATQILRHRSFVFQQFSQRYSEVVQYEDIELRKQDTKNRQNSIEIPELTSDDVRMTREIYEHLDNGLRLYRKILDKNYAKEVARFVLPQNISTRLYMTGNVRSWIHYFQMRLHKTTQKEHRLVALEIFNDFKNYFPIISELMLENES